MSEPAQGQDVTAPNGEQDGVEVRASEPPPLHDPRRDHAAIRRLSDELLPALMARLEASPLGELEVRQDGWRVRLRKEVDAPNGAGANGVGPHGDTVAARPASGRSRTVQGERAGSAASAGQRAQGSPERAERVRRFITSPAVGTFHPAAGTSLGRAVHAGDVVGHVEVLGVPQEVQAPFDGTLGRVLVEPGQVVEYGEQLMRIE
jgi:biotin carboxyl carrier protein